MDKFYNQVFRTHLYHLNKISKSVNNIFLNFITANRNVYLNICFKSYTLTFSVFKLNILIFMKSLVNNIRVIYFCP